MPDFVLTPISQASRFDYKLGSKSRYHLEIRKWTISFRDNLLIRKGIWFFYLTLQCTLHLKCQFRIEHFKNLKVSSKTLNLPRDKKNDHWYHPSTQHSRIGIVTYKKTVGISIILNRRGIRHFKRPDFYSDFNGKAKNFALVFLGSSISIKKKFDGTKSSKLIVAVR